MLDVANKPFLAEFTKEAFITFKTKWMTVYNPREGVVTPGRLSSVSHDLHLQMTNTFQEYGNSQWEVISDLEFLDVLYRHFFRIRDHPLDAFKTDWKAIVIGPQALDDFDAVEKALYKVEANHRFALTKSGEVDKLHIILKDHVNHGFFKEGHSKEFDDLAEDFRQATQYGQPKLTFYSLLTIFRQHMTAYNEWDNQTTKRGQSTPQQDRPWDHYSGTQDAYRRELAKDYRHQEEGRHFGYPRDERHHDYSPQDERRQNGYGGSDH
jgi:hypothetical protein